MFVIMNPFPARTLRILNLRVSLCVSGYERVVESLDFLPFLLRTARLEILDPDITLG